MYKERERERRERERDVHPAARMTPAARGVKGEERCPQKF